MSWPWWLVRPRLGVVLGGGATLGAFEVGVIDVFARRDIVPDLLVGTSVGAINAAFWAMDPKPDVGQRLLEFWLQSDRWTMFPDGRLPMVGRLVQRRDHLTTQVGLARALERAIPRGIRFEDARIPLAMTATDAEHGSRVVLRSGPLLRAMLASSAIPGLWPAVEVDGHRLFDGSVVANCDLQSAVDAGMTDLMVVDLMGNALGETGMDFAQVVERTTSILLRRQTELEITAFGRGVRVAVLRPSLASGPRFADFSFTRQLFQAGQLAAGRFLGRHMGPRRSVRPGIFDRPPIGRDDAIDPDLRLASG